MAEWNAEAENILRAEVEEATRLYNDALAYFRLTISKPDDGNRVAGIERACKAQSAALHRLAIASEQYANARKLGDRGAFSRPAKKV